MCERVAPVSSHCRLLSFFGSAFLALRSTDSHRRIVFFCIPRHQQLVLVIVRGRGDSALPDAAVPLLHNLPKCSHRFLPWVSQRFPMGFSSFHGLYGFPWVSHGFAQDFNVKGSAPKQSHATMHCGIFLELRMLTVEAAQPAKSHVASLARVRVASLRKKAAPAAARTGPKGSFWARGHLGFGEPTH